MPAQLSFGKSTDENIALKNSYIQSHTIGIIPKVNKDPSLTLDLRVIPSPLLAVYCSKGSQFLRSTDIAPGVALECRSVTKRGSCASSVVVPENVAVPIYSFPHSLNIGCFTARHSLGVEEDIILPVVEFLWKR